MAIITLTTGVTGQVGVTPRRNQMVTTDNLARVTSPGYLSNSVSGSSPQQIQATDIFDVVYSYNPVTKSGTYGQFLPIFNDGIITLDLQNQPLTGEPLTVTDDINVILILSGSPNNSLLEPVNIAVGWDGLLGIDRGGTNLDSYVLGDMIYASAANVLATLSGNTSTTKMFLSQTGTGSDSAAPVWSTISASDITGILDPAHGGTGVNNGSNTITIGGSLNFANSFTTAGNFPVILAFAGSTNVTFPTSGTLATTSQLPNPSALTANNDTNVTLSLGGSPNTALLQAASITAGWDGQLGLTRGGTNASLTASNGGIVYSTASALAILNGTSTANLPLLSQANTAPVWGAFALSLGGDLVTGGTLTTVGAFGATFTFTNTTAVTFPTSGTLATTSQIPSLPLSTTNGGTGASTTATIGKILIGNGSTWGASAYEMPTTLLPTGKILWSNGVTGFIESDAIYPYGAGASGTILRSNGFGFINTNATYPNAATVAGAFLRSDGTNWLQSAATLPNAAGTSGTLLTSNGSGFVNTTATYPGTATSTGTMLRADGTNWVPSTATYPGTATSTGTILRANGTNWVASTATYPNTATSTGTMLRADGTNWVASTTTYPDTNAINTIPYASSANVFGSIATANDAVLQTDSSGVPSMSAPQTYTPTIGDGTNNFSTSSATGYYMRVGGRTFLSVRVVWTGKGSAVAGNILRISLPFTTSSSPNRYTYSFGYVAGITSTTQLLAVTNDAENYIRFFTFVSGAAPNAVNVSGAATTGEIQLSGFIN